MSRRSIRSLWNSLLGSRPSSHHPARHALSPRRTWGAHGLLSFEPLEDRSLLAATLFVDPSVAPSGTIFSSIGSAVAAAHTGDTIKVVGGTYHETVNVDKTLTLVGGQVRVAGQSGPSIVGPATPSGAIFLLNANGITVKNFTIRDGGVGVSTSANFSGYQILHNTFANDVREISLQVSTATTAKTTTISGNKFTMDNQSAVTPEHCIVSGAARNVKISSNLFQASSTISAIVFADANTPSVNVQIVNNTINNDNSIVLANVSGAKIDSNTFIGQSSNVTPIHLAGGVTNSQITNNSMLANGTTTADGIDLDQDIIDSADSNNKITMNTVVGYTEGIFLRDSSQNLIANNVVARCTNVGIFIFGTNSTASTANTVSGNFVTDGDSGITSNDSGGNMISKNAVSATTEVGINVFSGPNSTIAGNNVSHNSSVGILVRFSSQAKVTGNTAIFNGDRAIFVINSPQITISGNVANNNLEGIDVDQASDHTTISGNKTNNNNGAGILSGASFTTVSKNTANHNVFGMGISGDAVTFTGNTTNNNIENGFGVGNSNLMLFVKGNVANNNGTIGFAVSGVGQVLGNTANSNGVIGISLVTTNSQITGNKAMNNDGDGIRVFFTATGNMLSGNVAMGNGDAVGGFDLEDLTTGGTGTAGTKNTWSGNKFKTSSPAGLK